MRLVDVKYGKLIHATDLEGKQYADWRSEYFDISGTILTFRSEHREGYYVYFFPHEPDMGMQRRLQTSLGQIKETDKQLICTTVRSIYTFEKNADCLSDMDKFFLNAQSFGVLVREDRFRRDMYGQTGI